MIDMGSSGYSNSSNLLDSFFLKFSIINKIKEVEFMYIHTWEIKKDYHVQWEREENMQAYN